MNRILLPLAAVAGTFLACRSDDDAPDTDTDDGATDTTVETDTDPPADTGDTAETDETDVVDTDGEHVVVRGQLLCELPGDTDTDGVPATPGFVEITITTPWNCPPLSACNKLDNYEVIARDEVDEDGVFDLDFQTNGYTVDELFLYTDIDKPPGPCGNGYHFTQWKLNTYEDWSDIVIDVDSIFY